MKKEEQQLDYSSALLEMLKNPDEGNKEASDAKKAAELAGYKSHYHHVVKTLKSEILELTQEILANSAPKAAFKLVEIMDSKKPIIQANNKLTAAQTLLDRVGVTKVDKVDVTHNMNAGGIFLMPDKAPLDIEDGEYEDISD